MTTILISETPDGQADGHSLKRERVSAAGLRGQSVPNVRTLCPAGGS
jgi:hypothetical protein